MQMHAMLTHALNQHEVVNWVPVPALKIKAEISFLSYSVFIYK